MKKLCIVLATLCLLAGCAGKEAPEADYYLYYTALATTAYGASIQPEGRMLEGETLSPKVAMDALLAGPTDPALASPFPPNTALISVRTQEGGVLRVNLTEEYAGLTGISLTLADYCIVQTLCQLDGVSGVEICAAGEQNPYRAHQILTMDDVT